MPLLHGPDYYRIIISTAVTLTGVDYKEGGQKTAGDFLFAGPAGDYCVKSRAEDEVADILDLGKQPLILT